MDTRSGAHVGARAICRRLGVLRRDEAFALASLKTKTVFVVIQLVYTLLTFLPAFWCHALEPLHSAALVFVFTCAVWNGANYYIEVFSKSFDKLYKEPSEHLAGDAGAAVQAASEVLASSTHAS